MIVLDTNVLSAVMSSQPDAAVVAWLDRQREAAVWLTSVTVFEVRFGVALLPAGKRRRRLEDAFARILEEDFADRVLAFDSEAAGVADEVLASLDLSNHNAAVEIARVPEQIKGYGHVKERNLGAVRLQWGAKMQQWRAGQAAPQLPQMLGIGR